MARLLLRVGLWSDVLYERLERRRAANRRERGMALVVVLATIAILSVSVVEFTYNTRVNLYLAQNHRDEAKAYFLARSGVNLQMLAIAYQYEMQSQPLIGEAMTRSGFQLWRYIDYLLPTFTSGRIDAGLFGSVDLEEAGAEGFGGVHGDIQFHTVEAEEGKINLNAFASQQINQEQLNSLCALLSPPIENAVPGFDEAAEAEARFEVIAAIIDYVDPDSDVTVIDSNCVATVGGAGQEAQAYIDVDWEPKNEPFITLDEVLLVPGVTPALLERFRQRLTVYPVPNKVYVNLADAQQFAALLCTNIQGAQVTGFSPCNDPQWRNTFGMQITALSLALEGYNRYFENIFMMLGNIAGMGTMDPAMAAMVNSTDGRVTGFSNPRRFRTILESMIQQPEVAFMMAGYADPAAQQLFGYFAQQGTFPQFTLQFDYARMESQISTDVPKIFAVSATGQYGPATRTIRTIMDFRDPANPSLMYYREF